MYVFVSSPRKMEVLEKKSGCQNKSIQTLGGSVVTSPVALQENP